MISALEYLEKEESQDYLSKHLMLKLAPVLVWVKPASLIAVCNCEKSGRDNFYDVWQEQKADIARILRISFKELKDKPEGKQVLFYNPELLFDTVTRAENLSFLEKFGYFSCKTIEDYLEVLRARFNNLSFPHEIGIFLGYPLKDVKGFIEKGSLPLTKKGNWQVFGEPEKSVQLMNIHKKAEEVFLKFVENQRNPLPFIERLNRHFRKVSEGISYGTANYI